MTSLRMTSLSWRIILLLGGLMLWPWAKSQAQPTHRAIAVGVESIRIADEDDGIDHDEPYLIVTRFQFRVRLDAAGRLTLVPGTLSVTNIMSGHNNLGRRDDNWAAEGNTYTLPKGHPRYAQAMFPWGEEYWVLGVVITHLEEDGFAYSTAKLLGDRIRDAVETALRDGSFDAADARQLSSAIIRKVSRDLSRAAGRFDVGGIIRGLASKADPDDYGGTQVVAAVTAPGNRVFLYSGAPTTDAATLLRNTRELGNGTHSLSLKFPAGDLSHLPWNARFCGEHSVNLKVSVWEQGTLY
ncbi:MAG: hypothetical protein NZM42_11460 [Gemmatales bacterium]|nr:hypothetical protein [Gemmatales bacterium]MDW8224269.1 hypothetical protein [Gemmatales bacterium]